MSALFFQTPLQLAVIHGADTKIVECLLGKAASLEVTDPDGNNIIHLAVQYERTRILSMLLESIPKKSHLLDQHNHEGK